jgi:uncharacterized protein
VVAGHLGVFEGNGGDLRIGLPMQSLHDGHHLQHTPLRLSVFIEAPRQAIDTVMAGHEIVRHLVGHGWLHLFCIDPETKAVDQYRSGHWVASVTAVASGAAAGAAASCDAAPATVPLSVASGG